MSMPFVPQAEDGSSNPPSLPYALPAYGPSNDVSPGMNAPLPTLNPYEYYSGVGAMTGMPGVDNNQFTQFSFGPVGSIPMSAQIPMQMAIPPTSMPPPMLIPSLLPPAEGSSSQDPYNAAARKNKRKIKNRESAARSRLRKQAYDNQLAMDVQRLMEEKERLEKELRVVDYANFVLEEEKRERKDKANRLRRTVSL